MKTIEPKFKTNGFCFEMLKREGNVALFTKSKPSYGFDSYEVVIIQQLPAQTIYSREYPPREAMPSSESWGRAGWTCSTRERADERFRMAVESCQNADSEEDVVPTV